MIAGSPIIAPDGHYVALFPMDFLHVTQTWGAGTLSHRDFQTDWVGTHAVYPYYACAPMTVYKVTPGSGVLWCTDEPVHTRQGLQYLSVWCAHDAHIFSVGDRVNAGDILGHTGTRGQVTGDHLHIDASPERFAEYKPPNHEALMGDIRPDELWYIDGREVVSNLTADGITLNFETWQGGTSAILPALLLLSKKRRKKHGLIQLF